jgi:hypothetical protein
MIWTIDTWVLMGASGQGPQNCQEFLWEVLGGQVMALSEEVLKEYEKKALADKDSFAAIWYGKMWGTGRVKAFFEPEEEKATALRTRLKSGLPRSVRRFHQDDVPFVVLCFRTEDRHLISGDVGEGDFSPALTAWLHKDYRICFHELAQKGRFTGRGMNAPEGPARMRGSGSALPGAKPRGRNPAPANDIMR